MNVLITGAAGFIGHFLAVRLAKHGYNVIGIDNLNDYYDIDLKKSRLLDAGFNADQSNTEISKKYSNYQFMRMDILDKEKLFSLLESKKFTAVCHLAAQAGVRYSIENPDTYVQNNIQGFLNILEGCRYHNIKHLIYASSSSVYGGKNDIPYSVTDNVDYPVSVYAATKKSNELLAYTYSHLYNFSTTGLRFFTVYGPWGRPDMAPMLFLQAAFNQRSIKVFNQGQMLRDFTYIDDIVEGIVKVLQVTVDENLQDNELYKIYNLGNGNPTKLFDFIYEMERVLGFELKKEMYPMQAGDVKKTFADMKEFKKTFAYKPKTPLATGVANLVAWYKDFYGY